MLSPTYNRSGAVATRSPRGPEGSCARVAVHAQPKLAWQTTLRLGSEISRSIRGDDPPRPPRQPIILPRCMRSIVSSLVFDGGGNFANDRHVSTADYSLDALQETGYTRLHSTRD